MGVASGLRAKLIALIFLSFGAAAAAPALAFGPDDQVHRKIHQAERRAEARARANALWRAQRREQFQQVGGAAGNRSAMGERRLERYQERLTRAKALASAHPKRVELDRGGRAIARGAVLGIGLTPEQLARAEKLGFGVKMAHRMPGLGLTVSRLTVPDGMSATDALDKLRAADPKGAYELNHLYEHSQNGVKLPNSGAEETMAPARMRPLTNAAQVGLLDSGVDPAHPLLAGYNISQHGFAEDQVVPGAHGLAVASILAQGLPRGSEIDVADVYGDIPDGGDAVSVAKGLAWLAEKGVRVINVSLVGPPNALLEAAVHALINRGVLIVAAVGNDGPAAPPLYPAAYPGVIGVTAVDEAGKPINEAERGPQVQFAARGDAVHAAAPGGGIDTMRGTSFATPVVAACLALLDSELNNGRNAVAALEKLAKSEHPGSRDDELGYGIIAPLALRSEAAQASGPH